MSEPDEDEIVTYKLSIYIAGMPGFFQYEVPTREQAMDHFGAITETGYRRVNERGMLEWFSPHLLRRIRIEGPGLGTNYPDTFQRT